MRKSKSISYQIEVEHKPGYFEQDMSFLSFDPRSAYEHYIDVKKKYKNQKIIMREIIVTREEKPLSSKRLEKIVSRKQIKSFV